MRRVQVFDVNETLLDLAAMDPHFQRVFGDAGMRRAWFGQMIQSALVATITGAYRQFGEHAMAALEMVADQAGVELTDDDRGAIGGQMRELPAHPEVPDALRRLRDEGFRMAALTNSTLEVARAHETQEAYAAQSRPRAGIEGTLSQAVRTMDLRRARYIGLAKVHLQHVLTAAALNLVRVAAWLAGTPLARTRRSAFIQLMTLPA